MRKERGFGQGEVISWPSGGQIAKGWSVLLGQQPWKGFCTVRTRRAVDKSRHFHGHLGVAVGRAQQRVSSDDMCLRQDLALTASCSRWTADM